MFLTGRELVCGVTMLTGTARRVGGRYIVDGTWPYASGSQFADWGMAGVKLLSEDGANAGVGYAFIPFADVRLTTKSPWNRPRIPRPPRTNIPPHTPSLPHNPS